MTLKRWVLGKVNATSATRDGDARRVAPTLGRDIVAEPDTREPKLRGFAGSTQGRAATDLGPYAPLVSAIRDELEQFVATQLRLHLTIADGDRYVLTSIEIECHGNDEQHALLLRFLSEFRPEQIKQYLAREVIAGLRNASAIDMSQFAGLNAAQSTEAEQRDDDGYDELLQQLRNTAPPTNVPPYQVTLLGRWSGSAPSADLRHVTRPTMGLMQGEHATASAGAQTPLAGRSCAFEVEDARGLRRVEIPAAMPGRRYAVGKDEACDIVVDGQYASRRHCEIWFDVDGWWVRDTGSTNGIRVDAAGAQDRRGASGDDASPSRTLALEPGAWLVLSAHAHGDPARYPRLALRSGDESSTRPAADALVTPIAPPRARSATLMLRANTATGVRDVPLAASSLPLSIGRSRNQGLVIDWAHPEVSGRHLEIVAVDADGADVVVHGDNGISIGETRHQPGERVRWSAGEPMILGRGDDASRRCTLTLESGAAS